jgi:hypothetical protein
MRSLGLGNFGPSRRCRHAELDWTVRRPSSFQQLPALGTIKAGAPIPNLTSTATRGVVDPRDVAAVAVEVLTETVHSGQA